MLRKINRILNLYLCQSADWQYVVEAQDEECAATEAVEKIMLSKEEGFALSNMIAVKKLSNSLIEMDENFDRICYYSPIVLANAGFHIEANNLHTILVDQSKEIENE